MPAASPRRHLGAEPSTPTCLVPGRLYYDQSFYQEVFNPPIEADEDQDYVSSHPRSHTLHITACLCSHVRLALNHDRGCQRPANSSCGAETMHTHCRE